MPVCPSCGEENPERARLCMMCGRPLHAPTPRRQRRVVSVLFADLVGFTSRAERLDVEDVEGLLAGYHRLLRRELERHGGTVEKFIGDAVMAVFGAPVAHEDDPERAVRAALAIQDAVQASRERDGLDLHVRVGVTTGEALVALGADPGRGEGMATGDVVNTAARLQASAPADGVLVDETTYRATERHIRFEGVAPVAAKGKSDAVAAWRALETRALGPEQPPDELLPLVGRAEETAQLVTALGRSRREPSTQLVTLIGAPGIGKTRLTQELLGHVERAPEIVRWRRGRSLPYGEGIAFWALGEMVKSEAGILESDSAASASEKLAATVATLVVEERDREWVGRHLRPLVGLEGRGVAVPEGGRVEAFAAWRRFFEALAEDGPSVLVFEDLHWADEALLEFIDLLADRAGAVPLLIVCTARPELLERRPGWGGGKTNTQTILLAPLSEADTARLVAELLEQALLPADVQRALLTRAEGNPLYAQEYVRMLRDRGLLVREDGRWRLAGAPAGVPESVQGIIAARLDTLREDERALVQDAAVVGKTSWLGAVASIAGRSPHDAEDVLVALERKQLVRRQRRTTVAGEVEFSFAHTLTQEVAYGQIPRLERAAKHERAAEWIGRLSGEREDKAEMLAHHLTTALRLREQAGEQAGELRARASAALVEAANQAQAVNAHATAARHLRAALELAGERDPARPGLLRDFAMASSRAGETDEASLEALHDELVAAGDWHGAAEVAYLLGLWVDRTSNEGERAEQAYAWAAEHASRIPYAPVASLIAYRQSFRLVVGGRPDAAIAFTARAMERAGEAGDEQGRALLLLWLGFARVMNGDLEGGALMEEALAVLAQHHHSLLPIALHNHGEHLLALGDLERAGQSREEAAAWAERFAEPRVMTMVDMGRAEVAYHLGDWTAALRVCEQRVDDASINIATYARWTRSRIALAGGDVSAAADDAEMLLAYADTSRSDESLFPALAVRALVHHERGQAQAARATAERFARRWLEIGGMLTMSQALAEVARLEGSEEALAPAVALLPEASRWRAALLATVTGHHSEAAEHYRAMGSRPLEAAAWLRAAASSARAGRSDEAAQATVRALAFYRSVGAARAVAEAEALARRSA